MNPEQRKKLEASTGLGKKGWAVDKKSGISQDWGTVVDQVSILVGDSKHLIQRVRSPGEPGSKPEFWLRTGYYTFDRSGKKVVWGQNAQCLSESDFRELPSKAEAKGWPIF